jgi:hypothetical protein
LNVEGCELDHIYYLRTLGNIDAIGQVSGRREVVMVGGSYRLRVAASLTMLDPSTARS